MCPKLIWQRREKFFQPHTKAHSVTTMSEGQLQQLISSFIYYNSDYRLAICQPCGSVLPKNVALHLYRFHDTLSHIERTAIVNYINTLEHEQPDNILKEISFETEIDAIEGLPIDEVACCTACKLLGAESTIIKHCQNKHNWITGRGNSYTMYC